ncbi:hypothetical protein K450DRAFT_261015 [Umbelopsis ramanniana AG]|uniref:Uncharacterized protein n=1 Tax=Umbelopsis ramanniana AG TaxID=1314678 RepID=A0AAD5E2H4_UMBRA|nr:uncharacterized protein K450DRAFT_261015 [Umbelopsis ramanniana AG]KAI8575574.1 hypothetical protein K450DRAFT_261015 [Umbelopsis ramanniana AG]
MSGRNFHRNHQPSSNAFNPERLGSDRNRRNYNGGGRTIARDRNLQNDRQITFLDSSQMEHTNDQSGEQRSRSHNSPPPQRGRPDRTPNPQSYRSSNGHPRSDPPSQSGVDSRNFHRSNSHRSPERSIAQRDRKPIITERSNNVAQRLPPTPSSRQSDRNDVRYNRQGPYSRSDNSNRRWERPSARDEAVRNTSPPRRNENARQDSRTSSSQSSRGSHTEDRSNRDGNTTAEGSESRHARKDPPVQSSCDTQSREITTKEEHSSLSQIDTLSFITSKDIDQDDLDFEGYDDVVTDADLPQPDATQPEQRDNNSLDLNDASDSTGRSHREESTTKSTASTRKEPEHSGPQSPHNIEDRNQPVVSPNNSVRGNQKASSNVDREPPPPWKKHYSRRDGRVYYHNEETDISDRKRKAEDERDRSTSNHRGPSSRSGHQSNGPSGKGKARESDPPITMPDEKRPKHDYNDSKSRNDHHESRHRFPEPQSRPNIPMPLVSQEELFSQQGFDRRSNRPSFPVRGSRPMEPTVRRRPRDSPPPVPLPLDRVPNRPRSPPRRGRPSEDISRPDDPRRRRDNHPIPARYPRRPVDNPNDVPLPPRDRSTRPSQPSSSNNTSQDTRQYRDSNRPLNRRDDVITNSRAERNGNHKDNEPVPYHQSRHRQG